MTQTLGIRRRFLSLPYSVWALVCGDTLAIILGCALAYILRVACSGDLPLAVYAKLLPAVVGVFPLLFALLSLYPGTLLHPAEELKRLVLATTIGFLFLGAFFFVSKSADEFSRAFFLMAWGFSLLGVPLGRQWLRRTFFRLPGWSQPLILLGMPEPLQKLCAALACSQTLGFTPVALVYPEEALAQHPSCQGTPACSVHGLADSADDELFLHQLALQYPDALLAVHLPGFSPSRQAHLLEVAGAAFHQVLVLPGFSWLYCVPSGIAHLDGSFGLTVRRNLADKRRLRAKRILDLVLACLVAVLALPLCLLLGCLVCLDSKGPALFRQRRIGQNGDTLWIYKFRTMAINAEEVLQERLLNDTSLAAEWAADQKLRNDQRITRIGAFLRCTSLDELPQIINVLLGQMSLVGPRPIVEGEITRYGEVYSQYTRVLPGVTGLWQVSGRNDLSYEQRIALDRYYISNWSVWLDIYILVCTVPTVLAKRGAY